MVIDHKKLLESIGEPAALELLAEECAELAQAALKLARKERGENPTPKLKQHCIHDLMVELADVQLCINVIECCKWFRYDKLQKAYGFKANRWKDRLDGDGS